MSLDFEDRLRSDFAAVQVDIPIDADVTLAAGRRVRSRRIAVGIGALAVVTALAVVVTPSLLGRTTHAVPDPISTPIPEPTATHAVAGFDGARLFGDGGFESASVVVDRLPTATGIELRLTVSIQPVKGGPIRKTFTRPDQAPWTMTSLGNGFYAGVIPAGTRWLDTISPDGNDGWLGGPTRLAGMDLDAVVLSASSPSAARPGQIWRESDGVVHNSLDQVVASAEADLLGTTAEVYADSTLDRVGIKVKDEASGSYRISELSADGAVGALRVRDESGLERTYAMFMLPAGASDPSVEGAVDGLEHTEVTLRGGALDGRLVALVAGKATGKPAPKGTTRQITAIDAKEIARSISYTDAAGKRVTIPVGRK